ncbi:MAG: hemolysin [Epulopiscium sp. Nuni2H_MBin003]|nr:MAG: hemolysin [Epulopiscium sp. Nuni2H_MBin003]
MNTFVREPINCYTHLGGAILFILGTIVLFVVSLTNDTLNITSCISILIFGLSLVALYTTSGIYHMLYVKDATLIILRKLDHAMIFILIAGSYTPFCLLSLTGAWKWGFISVIWILAIIGILLKIFWMNMPRILSTGMYVGMGWLAVIAINPLYKSLQIEAFMLLLIGGIIYTIGGVIYAMKKPNISKNIGFHELFHIFCLLGSGCHYYAVCKYII